MKNQKDNRVELFLKDWFSEREERRERGKRPRRPSFPSTRGDGGKIQGERWELQGGKDGSYKAGLFCFVRLAEEFLTTLQ
jgi:hypothetical protein